MAKLGAKSGRRVSPGIAGSRHFLAILAVGYAAWRAGHLLVPWLLLVLVAFVAAIAWHRRVLRALERTQRAIRYYARALARLDDHWAGIGPSGERYASREHPYAKDLDLFGHGSLYQLLLAARTRMGQDRAGRLAAANRLIPPRFSAGRRRSRNCARDSIFARASPCSMRATTLEDKPETLLAWIGKAATAGGSDSTSGWRSSLRWHRSSRSWGGLALWHRHWLVSPGRRPPGLLASQACGGKWWN